MINRGSEWHKWDLHYHTPSSYDYKKKDKTNQEIVEELIENEVDAVVITDHHFIDFQRIKNLKDLAKDKVFFLRGIEITSELGGNEFVHFICIFPEKLEEFEIRDKFLSPLGISPEAVTKNKNLLSQNINYNTFLNIANELGCLISVHAGDKSNSIENIENWLKTKRDFKEKIVRQLHILETGKKTENKAYDEKVFPSIGRQMPIVVCSDYHAEYKYGKYKHNFDKPVDDIIFEMRQRDTTWIKSCLSFSGLKQIVFEPKMRVKIQDNNPIYDKFGIQAETIQIKETKLFCEDILSFNPEMIAIIGEKGSGKTALLDLMASMLGENCNIPGSFIYRGKEQFKNAKIFVKTTEADATNEINVLGIPSSTVAKCKYINPKILSDYCEEDTKMQEFIKDILENDAIRDKNKHIDETLLEIKKTFITINALQLEIDKNADLLNQIKLTTEKIADQKKKQPVAVKIDEKIVKEFQEKNEELIKLQIELENLTKKSNAIIRFNQLKVSLLEEKKNDLVEDLIFELQGSGFEIAKFTIELKINPQTDKELEDYQQKIYSEKELKEKQVNLCNNEVEKLKTQVFANEETRTKYENWKKYYEELQKQLQELQKSIIVFDENKNNKKELYNCCIGLLRTVYEDKSIILKFYNDLQDQLRTTVGQIGSTKIELKPIIRIETQNLQKTLEEVLNLASVDRELIRKNISLHYETPIKKMFASGVFGNEEIIKIIDRFIGDEKANFFEKPITSKIFKGSSNIKNLLEVAFSDFISIGYEIKFNEMTMDQLSTGQKGIVLLKLLLSLDKSNDPLIIDQPEDNLDNKSVFELLVEEFKRIKSQRQLIIATHNPNLVVNTDAEQIIIANYSRSNKKGFISYMAGALEQEEIRDEVCKILEGGKEAFVNRERKYNL